MQKCKIQLFVDGSDTIIGSTYFNHDLVFDVTNDSIVHEVDGFEGHSPLSLFLGNKAKDINLRQAMNVHICKLIDDEHYDY